MPIRSPFRSARPVPVEHRSNFIHLYFDIAWFGILAASTTSYTAIYATRQGANALQLGLLSASPAIVNLVFTLPSGRWLEGQETGRAVFWAALFHRCFYLLWLLLPVFFSPKGQVWALLSLTILMSIPGTFLAVGFNALFAEVVPPDWRGHVAGIRNALLSVVFIVISILCGQILVRLPFPTGYQVVFALGFAGAAMSTVHLWFLAPPMSRQKQPRTGRGLGDLAWPGFPRTVVESLRPGIALRFLARRRKALLPSTDILKEPFARLLVVFFAFYLAIYLAVPLFPIHWVNQLHLSDKEIGWGSAIFYVSVFVGSTQLERLVRWLGNRRVTALGAMFMGFYPAFMAFAQGLDLFLVGSIFGGVGWSLVGGALTNYVLEKTPEDHRPGYLAWYNLTLNAALLLGSLIGPVVAGWVGVTVALFLFACLRFLGALFIWRFE
jgi:MFS family permease